MDTLICSEKTSPDETVLMTISQKKRIVWFLFSFGAKDKPKFSGDKAFADAWKKKLEKKGFDAPVIEDSTEDTFAQAVQHPQTVAIFWHGHGQVAGRLAVMGGPLESDIEFYADPENDDSIIRMRHYRDHELPHADGTWERHIKKRICLPSISKRLRYVIFYACRTAATDYTSARRLEDLTTGPRFFPANPKDEKKLSEETLAERSQMTRGLDRWKAVLNHGREEPVVQVFGAPTYTSGATELDPNKVHERKRTEWADNVVPPSWDVGNVEAEEIIKLILKHDRHGSEEMPSVAP